MTGVIGIAAGICLLTVVGQALAQTAGEAPAPPAPTLAAGQQLFFNGSYEESAAPALALRLANPEDLAAYELRTSALASCT